jgi:osmoprotectant transport system ATP-binding protein
MSEASIRLDHVTKRYPGASAPAVEDLTMEMLAGQVTALVGPSGCGKTTILKMINRIIEPTSGRIEVAGRDIRKMDPHALRRGIGYVIQQVGLFPHRSVGENIATVPKLLGWDRRRTRRRVDELVELVGLEPEMYDRYPSELSGGQQQRVGVARALAADPPVLLMDEPFAAVDPIVRVHLQDELGSLQAQLQKTIVFVTHDIDEAIKLGDQVAILDVGGVLRQYASPEEVLRRPANAFVEEFLGKERGLRRLSLIAVRDVSLENGPTVSSDAGSAEAREVMTREGVNWVAIERNGELQGWVWESELEAGRKMGDLAARPFLVRVTADNTLREALDAIVTSHNQVAVVYDGDRYAGMLTLDRISENLVP